MPGHFRSHLLRSEIISGGTAVDGLASHPLLARSARPLVLAGHTVGAGALFTRVCATLAVGREPVVVRDVPSPARSDVVEQLAAGYFVRSYDAIVAVGGGSTLDTAKAIALVIARGGRVEEHAHTRAGPQFASASQRAPFLPIVAVPTTLSGSEANANASIRDPAMLRRFSLVDPALLPGLVVLDPAALASHRREILLGSTFNALAHCIEGIYSTRHHALADAQAETAARLLCSVLDDPASLMQPDMLGRLQLASTMAGALISEVYVGLHHAICHALVSHCGVQHAAANGAVLPWAVEFNLRTLAHAGPDRVATVARALDVPPRGAAMDTAIRIRERLDAMQRGAGIPATLSALGVARAQLDAVIDYTLQDRALNTNPAPVQRPDLGALLTRAF
jgi:alcohol dehydrogenase